MRTGRTSFHPLALLRLQRDSFTHTHAPRLGGVAASSLLA